MEKLFIPKTIKVGYQERSDTYTKRLAYVIYYDAKGKLRKEASWIGWCQLEDIYETKWVQGKGNVSTGKIQRKGLGSDDFTNDPTEGFVLNRGVGGNRQSWGWNVRNEYIRVFDPRGFEFEISVANLLYILQECTSTKGKGLEGKFVYAWDGTELVLLPVDTYEYEMSADFTDNQGKKLTKDDMVIGYTYQFKDMDEAIYLGRKEYNTLQGMTKSHIFYNLKQKEYFYTSGFTKIAKIVDTHEPADFAELVEQWEKKPFTNSMVGIEFKKITLPSTGISDEWYSKKETYGSRKGHWDRFMIGGTYNVVAIKGTTNYTDIYLNRGQDRDWWKTKDNHIDQYISKLNYRFEDGQLKYDQLLDDTHQYGRGNSKRPEIDHRQHIRHDINEMDSIIDQYDIYEIQVVLKDGKRLSYSKYINQMGLTNK